MSSMTVKELDEITSKIFELKETKDKLEEELSLVNKEMQSLERKSIEVMKELNLDSFKGSKGTLSPYEKVAYAVPKSEEERNQFFAYLKEKGVFDGMVTVHHATLNAYVSKEYEQAKEQGDLFFTIPGLGAPTITTILSKTKAKGKL